MLKMKNNAVFVFLSEYLETVLTDAHRSALRQSLIYYGRVVKKYFFKKAPFINK